MDRRQDMKYRTVQDKSEFGAWAKERGIIMDGLGGLRMVIHSPVGLPQ